MYIYKSIVGQKNYLDYIKILTMNNTSVLVPMLMVYLLFSKVSYNKL